MSRSRARLTTRILFAFVFGLLPWQVARADEGDGAADQSAGRVAAQPVNAATWKRIKKALPRVLWQQRGKKRKHAKALKTWAERG